MCQLWALHVAIKRKFFYIYICSFFTEFILQIYIIAQTYLRFCKNKWKPYSQKVETGNSIAIVFPVSIFGKSNHWRRSYDVVKIFKMAAVDVANQLPVSVW